MNKLILVGNIGGDVELRKTGNGTAVANVSLATTDGWGDNKKTNWHNLVIWGKTAESAAQYIAKGAKVAVEGSVEYQTWDKEDGTKMYKTVVNVSNWEFAGSKADSDSSGGYSAPPMADPNAGDETPF